MCVCVECELCVRTFNKIPIQMSSRIDIHMCTVQ